MGAPASPATPELAAAPLLELPALPPAASPLAPPEPSGSHPVATLHVPAGEAGGVRVSCPQPRASRTSAHEPVLRAGKRPHHCTASKYTGPEYCPFR